MEVRKNFMQNLRTLVIILNKIRFLFTVTHKYGKII